VGCDDRSLVKRPFLVVPVLVPALVAVQGTLEAAFSRDLLGAGVGAYRWFAFAGVDCRRRYDLCGDRAPRGLLAHR
jgi:hypothetical protein